MLQNEDANATLIIIEPGTGKQKTFTLGTGPHGGGYDDLEFDGDEVFISASNPSINTAPGIVRFRSKDKKVKLIGVLDGHRGYLHAGRIDGCGVRGTNRSDDGLRHPDREWAPESGRDSVHSGRPRGRPGEDTRKRNMPVGAIP